MKLRVIMDSGKEYIVEEDREGIEVDDFVDTMYNALPGGNGRVMANTYRYIDKENKILINPTHVSSIEVIED